MRGALPAGEGGEGGLAASSDGLGGFSPAAPPPGDCAESVRCSRGADAPGSLLTADAALTRRDLLAGAAAAPSALTLRGSATSPPCPQREEAQSNWEKALAALVRVEEEVAAFKRAEPAGASFAAQWEMDEAFSDLACLQNRALERLLLVPAPDGAALALKLARAVAEQAWELAQGEAAMALLVEDAERLASVATS